MKAKEKIQALQALMKKEGIRRISHSLLRPAYE